MRLNQHDAATADTRRSRSDQRGCRQRHAFHKAGIIQQEDAFVRLGVGKNMASSVAYWCDLTGVTESDPRQSTVLSSFGETVLGKELDPYLELPESLWLHWNANEIRVPRALRD